jgi:hypothetical protein
MHKHDRMCYKQFVNIRLYHRQGVKSAFKRSEHVDDNKHCENAQGEDQGEECHVQFESASAGGSIVAISLFLVVH